MRDERPQKYLKISEHEQSQISSPNKSSKTHLCVCILDWYIGMFCAHILHPILISSGRLEEERRFIVVD